MRSSPISADQLAIQATRAVIEQGSRFGSVLTGIFHKDESIPSISLAQWSLEPAGFFVGRSGYLAVVITLEGALVCTEAMPVWAAAAEEYIWLFPMTSPFWALSTK